MLLFPRFHLLKWMPIKTASLVSCFLSLAACGGGGTTSALDDGMRYSLSGTIKIADNVQVDSDNNDVNAPLQSNDTITDAQKVDAFLLLSGFVAKDPTGIANQRFKDKADVTDIFKATLLKGQVITLTISEWEKKNSSGETPPNLDLILFDSEGKELTSSSNGGKRESLTVSKNATYYIAVEASSGHSGYLLAIDQGSSSTQPASHSEQTDFMLGEAIVQYREPSVQASVARKAAFHRAGVTSNHNATDRPALIQFNPQDISDTSVTELSTRAVFTTDSTTTSYSTNNVSHTSLGESAFRQELAQIYPKLYQKLKTLDVIKSLNQRDDVAYAEPNYIRHAKLIPNDRGYESQWHYPLINLPKAWDVTTGTPDTGQVIVAVIDTGILPNHPDLKDQLVPGYDFLKNIEQANDGNGIDSDPTDTGDGDPANSKPNSWHGSHVAGTIAAKTNNSTGVAGVSWGAKIMPLRALGVGGGTTYSIVQSIRFAAGLSNDSGGVPAQRADIINMSLGGPDFSQAEQNAMEAAHNAGVILVAAAGNESSTSPSYPAAYDHVISVSSIAANGSFATSYSNSGGTIDVAAPGGDTQQDFNNDGYADGVLSTVKDDRTGLHSYAFYEGTSMAAPHVSGVLALMKAINPSLTPKDIESALIGGKLTTDAGVTGRDNFYGYGIIDAYKAVTFASSASLQEIVISPSSNDLQFASFQTTKVLDLKNLGSLGNSDDIQISVETDSVSWLSVSSALAGSGALASYRFTVNRDGLGLGVYEATARFSFVYQGKTVGSIVPVKIKMYVGLSTTAPDAGPLYILARQQGVELKEGEYHPEAQSQAFEGEYQFTFKDLKPGQYIIHAGTDSDSNLLICNEHEACGFYPSIIRPLVIDINRNITGLNFSVSITRPIDLSVNANQKTDSRSVNPYAIKRRWVDTSPKRSSALLRAPQGVNE